MKVDCYKNCEHEKEASCTREEISVFEDGCGNHVEVPGYQPFRCDNVVIYDNAGRPSTMVRFSRITNKELFGGSDKVHPAFIVGGAVQDEIYISKYQNHIVDGRAYSTFAHEPAVNINLETAEKACFEKGEGWHLMTNAEWALVSLVSLMNGTLPHGNTNYGKYHGDCNEKGQTFDGSKILTGTGPDTWSHDHTYFGVMDMCGNIWERVRGLRLKNGKVQVVKNNNAALPIDLSEGSKKWKTLKAEWMKVRIEAKHDVVRFTTDKTDDIGYDGCKWKDVDYDFGEVPEELKELALFPGEPEAYIYADTEGERLAFRGSYYGNGARAGVFAVYLAYPRSGVGPSVGFRSAFYGKLKSDTL